MSNEAIFLETAGKLQILEEQPYAKESILQKALEDYPQVIAGMTTASGESVRLALVKREFGVPGQQGGSQVWALDHLFVDSEGVPVLIEVKRASDLRIRREVVGQMLDYAANGLKYWPIEQLRSAFEATHDARQELLAESERREPNEWLAEVLQVEDPEDFWKQVEANLRAGHVRMVFVADRLPRELVRIVEFLNEQMSEAEVLGIELRQYLGADDQRVFVPSVVGRTSRAIEAKTGASGTSWNLDSFMAAAIERRTDEEVAFVEELLGHVERCDGYLKFGSGLTPGLSGWYPLNGDHRPVFNLNINVPTRQAYLSFYVADLAKQLSHEQLEQALAQLEAIPAYAGSVAATRQADYVKWPTAFLPAIVSEPASIHIVMKTIETMTGSGPSDEGPAVASVS